ncbi:hypothetical protein F4780DRAFT_269102 [Xylariomycetidae sp. FL0641]|nr:hypothetical protein F4780DRAFT_269102 [Xylariomycetidae sp. FL0641]
MAITIDHADQHDLPALAEINRQAYARELIFRFAFNSAADDEALDRFFEARIVRRFDDGRTRIFKATDTTTDTIVGFACWTLESRDNATPPPTGKAMEQMTSLLNMDFLVAAGSATEQLSKCREGETHYCR